MNLEYTATQSPEDIPEHVIAKTVETAYRKFANDVAFDSVRTRVALVLNEQLSLGLSYVTPERLRTLSRFIDEHINDAMTKVDSKDRHASAVVGRSPLIQSLLVTYWHSSQVLRTDTI